MNKQSRYLLYFPMPVLILLIILCSPAGNNTATPGNAPNNSESVQDNNNSSACLPARWADEYSGPGVQPARQSPDSNSPAVTFCLVHYEDDTPVRKCYTLDVHQSEFRNRSSALAMESSLSVFPPGSAQKLRTADGVHEIVIHYEKVTLENQYDSMIEISVHRLSDGRQINSYALKLPAILASPILMLNESLYVNACVDAGPGCDGLLYDAVSGEKLLALSGEDYENPVSMYAGDLTQIDVSDWVFVSGDGADVVRVNVNSGRVVARGKAPASSIDGGAVVTLGRCFGSNNTDTDRCVYVAVGGVRAGEVRMHTLTDLRLIRTFQLSTCAPAAES